MTDHIRIGDTPPRVQYTANGSQVAFTFLFPVFAAADMEVWLGSLKQPSSAYSISGIGISGGGSVLFAVPPPAGTLVTLLRRLAIVRLGDYQEDGIIRAKVLNDELDYQTAAIQQVALDAGRAVRRSALSASTADLTLPDPVAGRAIKWNAAGTGLENTATDLDGVTTKATEAAASAASAAASAATATARAAESTTAAATATTKAAESTAAAAAATAQATTATTRAAEAAASTASALAIYGSIAAVNGAAASASASADTAVAKAAEAAASAAAVAASQTVCAAAATQTAADRTAVAADTSTAANNAIAAAGSAGQAATSAAAAATDRAVVSALVVAAGSGAVFNLGRRLTGSASHICGRRV